MGRCECIFISSQIPAGLLGQLKTCRVIRGDMGHPGLGPPSPPPPPPSPALNHYPVVLSGSSYTEASLLLMKSTL